MKEPDSSLKNAVAEFLSAPGVGERWFQLYLLSLSQSTNLLIKYQKDQGLATANPEPGKKILGKASLALGIANISSPAASTDSQRFVACMCSYIGLTSVLPEIPGSSVSVGGLKMIRVRHGCSKRAVAFVDTRPQYYLDCTISNDDDSVVKELLDSDPARTIDYFPLHKAAQAGCLKTARTLYNLLERPAQIDQEGRTPLHLAALGGSTEIIRLLLGNDPCGGYPRRAVVPKMIDIKDNNAQTPLILASLMGNLEATRLLIESGADLAIRDGAGRTALHHIILNCPEAVGDFLARDMGHALDSDHCNILHTAASSGNVQATSTLVNALRISGNLANVINALDDQKRTPLHYAAETGFTDFVEILLKYEMSEEPEKEKYQRAGELAAARGDLATLKLFISPANRASGHKFLQVACKVGQTLVVEYLLRNELVSPDGDGSLGSAPILLATSKCHDEMVRILLKYNASADIEDTQGKCPLHHAAETGNSHLALILLQHQAYIDAPDIKRYTPLHIAAKAGQVSVVKLLLQHGAEFEACSGVGETALHLAVESPESVEALLEAGADRATADTRGQIPLHMAARQKCYKSVDLLISEAGISTRDSHGRPPLFFAIKNNDIDMVMALCKGRYNLQDSQDRMHPALEWAVESSALDVLHFLLNMSSESINKIGKYGQTLIHKAVEEKSLEVLTLLLESGAAVNVLDESKQTALHDAANAGCVEIMRKLIESGAKVNGADDDERTPLHLAARADDVKGLAVLLEANASINMRDSEQRTPLHLATFLGYVHVFERLLEENADIHTFDARGRSPLHTAAAESKTAIAKLLLENGANPDQLDESGDTALHLAIQSLDASVVQLMLDRGADFKITRRNGISCLSLASGYGSAAVLGMLLRVESSSASSTPWDFEDMVAAYWQAIRRNRMETLVILLKKEHRLLDELSSAGSTGLETCLLNRGASCEEEPMATCLLEFGANPFKRHQADRKSSFELGIISRRNLKQMFIEACLELVSNDLSSNTLGLGFKELRIVTELDKPYLWNKLNSLRDATSAVVDNDGWGLDHFIHQSADRITTQLTGTLALMPTRTPTGLLVPPLWLPPDTKAEAIVDIAPSRLQASFVCE